MKHPIQSHRHLFPLAQWPLSAGARDTWHMLRNPANARHVLESVGQASAAHTKESLAEADGMPPPGARILGPDDFNSDGTLKRR